jgi:hypothetical protein
MWCAMVAQTARLCDPFVTTKGAQSLTVTMKAVQIIERLRLHAICLRATTKHRRNQSMKFLTGVFRTGHSRVVTTTI